MWNPRDGQPNIAPNHMALRVEWYAFGRQAALVDDRGAGTMNDQVYSIKPSRLLDGPQQGSLQPLKLTRENDEK